MNLPLFHNSENKKPTVGNKPNVPHIYDSVMPVSNTKSMSNTMCLSPTVGSY